MPRALSVLRAFPFSAEHAGISYLALHPVSWDEATVLEQRFSPGVTPEAAVLMASDLLHEDYAYVFEAAWDLWIPSDSGKQWELRPSQVQFFVYGTDFDEGACQQEGHIAVDLGLDSAFLCEELRLANQAQERIRANVQKLVDFTIQAQRSSGASRRLLWSESEENLADRLAARLTEWQGSAEAGQNGR